MSEPNTNSLYDIQLWQDGAKQYYEKVVAPQAAFASKGRKPDDAPLGAKRWRVPLPRIIPRYAYALFVEFIAPQPNGIYTHLIQGLPLDNVYWWDFVMSSGDNLVNVLHGVNGMEAHLWSAPADFNVERFILQNASKHRERVAARVSTFETHAVYINPYKHYLFAIDWLAYEIAKLDISVAPYPAGKADPILSGALSRLETRT